MYGYEKQKWKYEGMNMGFKIMKKEWGLRLTKREMGGIVIDNTNVWTRVLNNELKNSFSI